MSTDLFDFSRVWPQFITQTSSFLQTIIQILMVQNQNIVDNRQNAQWWWWRQQHTWKTHCKNRNRNRKKNNRNQISQTLWVAADWFIYT